MQAVAQAIKAASRPDPGPEFWESFNRDLHLKLARLAPVPAPTPFFRLPYYLVGAPVLVLVLFLAWSHLGQPPKSPLTAQAPAPPRAAHTAKSLPPDRAALTAKAAAPAKAPVIAETQASAPGRLNAKALSPAKAALPDQTPAAPQGAVTARTAASPQAALEPPSAQLAYVGMEDGAWQGEEVPSWDVEAVMADLTHQEREAVLKKIDY